MGYKMGFRKLTFLVALCALMWAAQAIASEADAGIGTDMATTNTRSRIRLYRRRGYNIVLRIGKTIYKKKWCRLMRKKTKTKYIHGRKYKFFSYKCKLCHKKKCLKYGKLNKRKRNYSRYALKYTKRCRIVRRRPRNCNLV